MQETTCRQVLDTVDDCTVCNALKAMPSYSSWQWLYTTDYGQIQIGVKLHLRGSPNYLIKLGAGPTLSYMYYHRLVCVPCARHGIDTYRQASKLAAISPFLCLTGPNLKSKSLIIVHYNISLNQTSGWFVLTAIFRPAGCSERLQAPTKLELTWMSLDYCWQHDRALTLSWTSLQSCNRST